jgi:hypothetical protein
VREVAQALERHAVVVVGMRGNPFCRRARRTLDAAGVGDAAAAGSLTRLRSPCADGPGS